MKYPCPVCATTPFSGTCPRCGYSVRKPDYTLAAGGGGIDNEGPNAPTNFVYDDLGGTVTWTVPSDPPSGGAPAHYQVRYLLIDFPAYPDVDLTDANWSTGTVAGATWRTNSKAVGATENEVTDYLSAVRASFGVRYRDAAGNLGTVGSKIFNFA